MADDLVRPPTERRPVPDGIAHEVIVLADPDGLAPSLQPVVHDDGRDLSALAAARPVSVEDAAT